MSRREPRSLNFYAHECTVEQIQRYLAGFRVPEEPSEAVAGIVPHAGWAYSGAVAAKVFKCISEKGEPDTLILLGATHRGGVGANYVYAKGTWVTPLGDVEVDAQIASALLASMKSELVEDIAAHAWEHSLEVQVPFVKYFFPDARIVPILTAPDKESTSVGRRIGEMARESDKEIVVIGSTDLTHYGDNYGFTPQGYGPNALSWMKDNDARIISMALKMDEDSIVPEAMKSRNACGAGAMAATVAAAKAMGAKKGILVEYTTSHGAAPPEHFHMAVGYAGIVF